MKSIAVIVETITLLCGVGIDGGIAVITVACRCCIRRRLDLLVWPLGQRHCNRLP